MHITAYTAAEALSRSLVPSPTVSPNAEFSGDGIISPFAPSSSLSEAMSVATPVPSLTVESVALPTVLVSPTPVVAVELPPVFEDPVV